MHACGYARRRRQRVRAGNGQLIEPQRQIVNSVAAGQRQHPVPEESHPVAFDNPPERIVPLFAPKDRNMPTDKGIGGQAKIHELSRGKTHNGNRIMRDKTGFGLCASKRLRLGVAVDERRQCVHDEDSERHAFRIASTAADAHREKSATGAKHKLALGCDGRRHIVRSHEACADDCAAGKDVQDRRHSALEKGKDKHRSKEGNGDVPRDHLADYEIRRAY